MTLCGVCVCARVSGVCVRVVSERAVAPHAFRLAHIKWNPIEQAFHWLKDYMRRYRKDYHGPKADEDCARAGVAALPGRNAQKYFKQSGYEIASEPTGAGGELLALFALLVL